MLVTKCNGCGETVRVFEVSNRESKISEHNDSIMTTVECPGSGRFVENKYVTEQRTRKGPKGGSSTAPPKRTTMPAKASADDRADEVSDDGLSAVERLWRAYNRLADNDKDIVDTLMERLARKKS